jgi:hypothetical protein
MVYNLIILKYFFDLNFKFLEKLNKYLNFAALKK